MHVVKCNHVMQCPWRPEDGMMASFVLHATTIMEAEELKAPMEKELQEEARGTPGNGLQQLKEGSRAWYCIPGPHSTQIPELELETVVSYHVGAGN